MSTTDKVELQIKSAAMQNTVMKEADSVTAWKNRILKNTAVGTSDQADLYCLNTSLISRNSKNQWGS
jgi:hypothetical protein